MYRSNQRYFKQRTTIETEFVLSNVKTYPMSVIRGWHLEGVSKHPFYAVCKKKFWVTKNKPATVVIEKSAGLYTDIWAHCGHT